MEGGRMAFETLLLSEIDGGEISGSSSSWADLKVILEHEVLEAGVKPAGSGLRGMLRISTPAD
jgi:hypothetical protein